MLAMGICVYGVLYEDVLGEENMEVETTGAPPAATTKSTSDGADQTPLGVDTGTPTLQATVETSAAESASTSVRVLWF